MDTGKENDILQSHKVALYNTAPQPQLLISYAFRWSTMVLLNAHEYT